MVDSSMESGASLSACSSSSSSSSSEEEEEDDAEEEEPSEDEERLSSSLSALRPSSAKEISQVPELKVDVQKKKNCDEETVLPSESFSLSASSASYK